MSNRVHEVGGVWASKGTTARWVKIYEVDINAIQISIEQYNANMTVEAARSLARQIYRLARRVEKANAE